MFRNSKRFWTAVCVIAVSGVVVYKTMHQSEEAKITAFRRVLAQHMQTKPFDTWWMQKVPVGFESPEAL